MKTETSLNRLGKPPGAKSHPELYLLFQMGLKTTDIIAMGFSKGMVYRYHKKYEAAKLELSKLLKKQIPPGERGGLEPD